MLVWFNGKFHDMQIGQEVTVFRCGSGKTTYGESARLDSANSKNLIFVTDSGAVVKTDKENLHKTVGKAAKEGYVVTLKSIDQFAEMIIENVTYWDEKKCIFVNK